MHKSVARIIKQLDTMVCDEYRIFDKLRDPINE